MTRHRNYSRDRRHLKALAVAAVLLITCSAAALLAPSGSVPPALADWPVAEKPTEPRPHPEFGAPITPTPEETPDGPAPSPEPDDQERADRAPTDREERPPAPVDSGSSGPAAPPVAGSSPDRGGVEQGEPVTSAGGGPEAPHADAGLASVVGLTNAHRSSVGCMPVHLDAVLAAYAEGWSAQQARDGFMHHSSDLRSLLGGAWMTAAENVAAGYPDAASVVAGWLASPGHRANIENCAFTSHGVGVAAGPDGRPYWTQVFAG